MITSNQLTLDTLALTKPASAQNRIDASAKSGSLKSTFQQFVGETFFQLMLKSMRNMHDKPAYLHGGQAEQIFQGQLDQELVDELAQSSGATFSDDLFELFQLQLRESARA